MKFRVSKNVSSVLMLSFIAYIALADSSYASDYTQIEVTLCKVLELLTGTIGKAIAAFAIIFIGVSLFMGKVSWGLAISTALGIGAIFGAAGIVEAISGTGGELDIADCAAGGAAAT